MVVKAQQASVLSVVGLELYEILQKHLTKRRFRQTFGKTRRFLRVAAAANIRQAGEISLCRCIVAEIMLEIPEGRCQLHTLMPRRFCKLHIGGVFALYEKLPDACRRLLPAHDLCGGQISCRVPVGDVDAVLGVPYGIPAVFGDDSVAAVECVFEESGDSFQTPALGELRGDLHVGVVGVTLQAQDVVDVILRDGHGKSGGRVALRFCDICDLLFLRGKQAHLICRRGLSRFCFRFRRG